MASNTENVSIWWRHHPLVRRYFLLNQNRWGSYLHFAMHALRYLMVYICGSRAYDPILDDMIIACLGVWVQNFCVKFERKLLDCNTKFWNRISHNMYFTDFYFSLLLTISCNCDVISLSEKAPWRQCILGQTKRMLYFYCYHTVTRNLSIPWVTHFVVFRNGWIRRNNLQ